MGSPLVPPPGYEPSDSGRVVLLSARRAELERLGLASLASALTAGELLRATPYKAIARIDAPGGAIYVKRYDYDRRVVFVKALLKANFPVFSGPRELANALDLRGEGFPVPLPLAAGEEDAGFRRRSFVALLAVPGIPLERLPIPEERIAREALIRKVAELVRRFHARGFQHRDLYLANILLDEATGALGLVDLERVRRRSGARGIVKDLGALDYSASGWSGGDRLRFLRAYLGIERLDSEARALARKIREKARSMARKGSK